ncbi:MAG: ribonuclease HII [Deltaproteobacteria bacterium]|nr:ribonuclease HII [Deltaproteobacteria bacterium]
MAEALGLLPMRPDHVLVDGNQRLPILTPQTTIVKGDRRSLSIAAASIVAKVMRDWYMTAMHNRWPLYNFARNKGYGTQEHRDALAAYGICPIHRRSFAPVARAAS